MGLVIRIKGADWSGKGYPLVRGFTAEESLVAGFDFRLRDDFLNDVSGHGFKAIAYRNAVNNTPLVADPSVLERTANGLGIVVRNGCLDFGVPNRALAVGGAVHFTMLIVGGYSGLPFDSGQAQAPAGATICNLADMGNGLTAGEVPPVLQQYRVDSTLGARVKASAVSNIGAAATLGRKTCFFLTYDGLKFVYKNMTTGAIVTKTNQDLGLTVQTLTPSTRCPTLVSGNYFVGTSAIIGLYPELYQVAQWNRVLTETEMQEQYAASKIIFSAVGV